MNTQVMDRPPLVKLIGTVIEIVPAPAANRSGKIKLDAGQILSAFPDKLQAVEVGGTYDFGVTETFKNNVCYRDVKAVKPAAVDPSRFAAPPRHATAARSLTPQPQPQRTAPVQNEPAPAHHNSNGEFNRQTHPMDARRMYICSMMSALIKSHQLVLNPLDPIAITEAIDLIGKGYDQSSMAG